MKPKKWNTLKLAGIGAIVGPLFLFFREGSGLFGPTGGLTPDAWPGFLLGGAAGGAILFAAVSGIRNFFAR